MDRDAVVCHVGPWLWEPGAERAVQRVCPREPALPRPEALSRVTLGWQRHLVLSEGPTDRRAPP